MKARILMTLIACITCLSLNAQIPQPDPDTTAKHFLEVASIGNLQEVSAGQLAIQKAKRSDVKSFGQMMVKDHGTAEAQLLQLARANQISLSPASTSGIQPDLNLKNAGDKFDKLYVHATVAGHRNKVQTFQNYAVTGKNPNVKVFAQKQLPTLKEHLAAIIAIEDQLNGKSN